MNTAKKIVSILLFFLFFNLPAQDLKFSKWQLDVAYFGNQVIRPGGNIELDYSILHRENWKNVVHRKNKEITHIRHHTLNANLLLNAFYFDSTKTWVNASLGLSYKRISGGLWITELGANIGYTRSFLSQNYPYLEWENDEKFPLPGAGYLNVHYYLNIGKYFRKPIPVIKGVIGGIHCINLMNYHGKNVQQWNLKLGIIIL